MVLTSALPRESTLVRALAGEPAEWSITDYLLAHTVDGINTLIWAYVTAHSKHRPKQPKPVPRPEVPVTERVKPVVSSAAEVAAFFGSINGQR